MIFNKLEAFLRLKTVNLRYNLDNYLFRRADSAFKVNLAKDFLKNKPCLIVGNGPSLNKTPLDLFSNVYSIGMNKIELFFPKTKWRPNLIVCNNNLVVKQFASSFSKSYIPVCLAWKTRFFINYKKGNSIRFFNLFPNSDFSVDINSGCGSGSTVTYSALQFANHIGGNPIILVGVDHFFGSQSGQNIYEKIKDFDSNHFDPNYFSKGQYWGLPDLQGSELNYALARKAIELQGKRVFDATVGGFCSIFEKISISDALKLIAP